MVSEHILLLESTISQLNKGANLVAFESEKKKTYSEMKYVLAKSNSLKRAATEKQQEMETSMKEKKELIEKKNIFIDTWYIDGSLFVLLFRVIIMKQLK